MQQNKLKVKHKWNPDTLKTMSQIVFYLFVGENKGSLHITFMYERKREASRGGGEGGGGPRHPLLWLVHKIESFPLARGLEKWPWRTS